MDAPQIQYAKTSDGVSIAYYTLGSGPPLVHMPTIGYSHLQLEWQIAEFRQWYERLAATRRVIRYDPRGGGMSDRDVDDLSVEGWLRDLEAVVDRLDLERFALMGLVHGGPVAVSYAARHPERISRLVLWCGYTLASEWSQSPQIQAMRASIEQDWETASEAIAHVLLGWSAGDSARRFASLLRQAITPHTLQMWIHWFNQVDVTEQLPHVQAPTLVLQRDRVPAPQPGAGRVLASGIPDARLVMLEGTSLAPYLEDSETAFRAIDDFLSQGEETAHPRPAQQPSGTAVILFADIADSTALTERLGDAAFRTKARELDEALRRAITSNGGTAIEGKLLGDGVLATFGAAREAIACAAAIHGMAGSGVGGRGSRPEDEALLLHVGIHAGDVIREEGNVYGGAVNIASRVAGEAAAGETLVSGTVRELARTSAGVSFEDRGERELKGVGEPVRVWAVKEQGTGNQEQGE